MSTLKYVTSKSGQFLVLDLDKKDVVDKDLYQALGSMGFRSMLPVQYNEKKKALRYDLNGVISLRVRMASSITLAEFYYILANFYKSYLFLLQEQHRVHPSKVDWDADLVFITSSGQVQFLVYPLAVKTVEGKGIYQLLRSMVMNAKPFEKSDEQGISRLKGFFERSDKGEISHEEIIYSLGKEAYEYANQNLTDYEPTMLKALMGGVQPAVGDSASVETIVESVGGVNLNLTYLDTEVLERTGVLEAEDEDDYESTGILEEPKPVAQKVIPHYIGYLSRKTGETFEFDSRNGSDMWVLGRKPQTGAGEVPVVVSGNKYISRSHFQIVYEASEAQFYISDVGSAYGTELDGRKLEGGRHALVPLKDRMHVKVANEDMLFKVKEV